MRDMVIKQKVWVPLLTLGSPTEGLITTDPASWWRVDGAILRPGAGREQEETMG